ncbi:MAG TPA: guanylate kinase [Lachnospiraceae bacterium]|nr:guanylate kinase [Lachnospiraceae bacterium]
MGKIYVVIGKSSTGKDTIFKILRDREDLHLKTVVGYTTRPIREGERDGVEYYFVTGEQLEEYRKQDKIIEHRSYDTVHGLWNYFTVNDGQINLATSDYLFINTLEAYLQIRKYYGEAFVVPIYIEVEDGERLERALQREKKQREPKYAELCRRFLADSIDFSEGKLSEAKIEKRYRNENLENCVLEIVEAIKSSQNKGANVL